MNKFAYHFLNGLFVVAAAYFLYDSLTYLYTVYKSVYDQSSALITVCVLAVTSWLSMLGVGVLFLPIANIFREERTISTMVFLDVAAIALSRVIVSFAVPMLSLYLLALLDGLFG